MQNKVKFMLAENRAYKLAAGRMEECKTAAATILDKAMKRISAEKTTDAAEIKRLENKLKDTQREEYNTICRRLDAMPENQDNATYWLNYYSSATGGIHETEKKRLIDRKAELEKILKGLPFTDEDNRLAHLRVKEYRLTDKEAGQIRGAIAELERQAAETTKAEDNLRDSIRAVKEEMEQLQDGIRKEIREGNRRNYDSLMMKLRRAVDSRNIK